MYSSSIYLIIKYLYLDNKIEEYNMKKKEWKSIADIPDFRTTNGLATKNNKL